MSWPKQPIEQFCSRVISGGTPSTKRDEYYGGSIPWLRTQEVTFEPIWDTGIKITEAGLKGSSAKWIPENSVVVAMYGASAGRVAINRIPITTNQACCNLIIDANVADYRYVYYVLRHRFVALGSLAKGSAQRNLNAGQIKLFKIPAPSLPEQTRIGSVLSSYDNLIENNRRRIQLLDQAARLLYKEWFVHLRFPGHEHVKIRDGVPEWWEKTNAFEAMEVLSGGTPKTGVVSYWDGDIPFFTPKDATEDVYVFETEKHLTEDGLRNCNSRLYPKDTVFITARGTVGGINLAQTDMAMNQSCYALVGRPPVDQFFLYFALVEGVEQFRSRAVGAVFDAIIRDTFKLIPFMVPPEALIGAFAEQVTPLLDQISNLLTQNRRLRKARDLLLPRLMSGEIAA